MKKHLKTLTYIVLSAAIVALLAYMFKDTNWGEVWAAIKGLSATSLVAMSGLVLLSFVARVQRWTYIVRAVKPVSWRHLFSATQIGFLANFTLPGRVGEILRAVVLSRLGRLPFSQSFAMVALDRVTDLVGLVAIVAVSVMAYSPSGIITIPARTFGKEISIPAEWIHRGELFAVAMLVVFGGVMAMLYINQALVLKISDACLGLVSKRLAVWANHFLTNFTHGFSIFRSPVDMAKSLFFSLITWGVAIVFLIVILRAFGIQGPWYTPFIMQLLLAVALSAPGLPGFVGQFHVPLVAALVMLIPGIDDSRAKALAIVAHMMNLAWIIVIGVACLYFEKLGFGELRRESEHDMAQADTGEPVQCGSVR